MFFLCLLFLFLFSLRRHIIEKGKADVLYFNQKSPESGLAWHHIIRPLDWLVNLVGKGLVKMEKPKEFCLKTKNRY